MRKKEEKENENKLYDISTFKKDDLFLSLY